MNRFLKQHGLSRSYLMNAALLWPFIVLAGSALVFFLCLFTVHSETRVGEPEEYSTRLYYSYEAGMWGQCMDRKVWAYSQVWPEVTNRFRVELEYIGPIPVAPKTNSSPHINPVFTHGFLNPFAILTADPTNLILHLSREPVLLGKTNGFWRIGFKP